jgi:Sulfotransferase family
VSAPGALDPPAPNLFVVGAAKAGTTSLWRYLDAHPDVFMSRVKEPHFFSRFGRGVEVVKDPAAYARLFADGGGRRYRGEASPSYLPDPETPGRLRDACPEARILVSLRDPVERAYANYWTYVGLGLERRSFPDAVREELAASEVDFAATPPPFVRRGFYAEQLERYRAAFGPSAVVVIFLADLAADVRGTMRSIFERLDLDPEPAESIDPVPHFPFRAPRYRAAAVALRVPGARRIGDAVLRGRLRSVVERAIFRYEKPPLDPQTRSLLREVYEPHDRRLQELLGAPLPWAGQR